MTSDKRAQKSRTDETSLSRSGYSASGLRAAWKISFNQSEALTRYGNMEFLRSFLRRHLAGKPVVASPNISCFLRLGFVQYFSNANKFVRISEW